MSDLEMIANHAAHRIFSECVPPLHDKRFKMELCEKIIMEAIKQGAKKLEEPSEIAGIKVRWLPEAKEAENETN